MNTRASRPTKTDAALTPEQKTSLKWLNELCVPGMYLDRLGSIRDYLAARLAAVAGEPQSATQGNDAAVFAIIFDDYERRHEIIIGEDSARARFKQISDSWNAHLFGKLGSNSRDDRHASNNIASIDAGIAAAPTADWGNRHTRDLSGWVNELLTLAQHHEPIPTFARNAMRTIAHGIALQAGKPQDRAEAPILGWRVEHDFLGPAFTYHEVQADLWIKEGRKVTELKASAADAPTPLTDSQIIAMRFAVPGGDWATETEAAFFERGVKATERHHGISKATGGTAP